jgi:hypothetical protein
MKLFKFIQNGQTHCGVEINHQKYDVSPHFNDYDEMFFESNGLEKLKELVQKGHLTVFQLMILYIPHPSPVHQR